MSSTGKNMTTKKMVIGMAISSTIRRPLEDEVALEREHHDEGEQQAEDGEALRHGFSGPWRLRRLADDEHAA